MENRKDRNPPKSSDDLSRLEKAMDRFLEGEAADAGKKRIPPPESETSGEKSPAGPGYQPISSPSTPAPPQGETETPSPDPLLEMRITKHGLEAELVSVFPQTTAPQIRAFLKDNGVRTGISESAIQQAVATAGKSGKPVRNVVVARGTPAQPEGPPTMKYNPPEGMKTLPILEPLAGLLASENPEDIRAAAQDLVVWRVQAGQVLANRVRPAPRPGTGVRGEPIPPPEPKKTAESWPFEPGPGVTCGPDGGNYLAAGPGYAGLLAGQIAVLTPIWLAPDRMTACYLAATVVPGSAAIRSDDIRAQLAGRGITVGIRDSVLENLCSRLSEATHRAGLVEVASGKPFTPPVEAHLEFTFPHAPQVGALRPDGSVDFKERGLFPPAEKETLLASLTPPKPGIPGKTVLGEDIPPPLPQNIELAAGDNARLEEKDGTHRVYASADGGASVQTSAMSGPDGPINRHTVSVRSVIQFPGDINYETGNIDFRGNVEVRGSVSAGFSLKATGAVNISGGVEAGAEVTAGGDLTVRLGIVGANTRVVSNGALTAKFIQDASVEAGGDVVVGSYIHGACLKTRGGVIVEGRGGSGGGIIGGETWSATGIKTRNLGSPRSTTTFAAVGVDPELYRAFQEAGRKARHAEVLVGNLLKALGLGALNKEEIRKLIARNPSKRKAVIHYVQKANQIAGMRAALLEESQGLARELAERARRAALDVLDTAYARVRLRIGPSETLTQKDLKAVRFALAETGNIVPAALPGR